MKKKNVLAMFPFIGEELMKMLNEKTTKLICICNDCKKREKQTAFFDLPNGKRIEIYSDEENFIYILLDSDGFPFLRCNAPELIEWDKKKGDIFIKDPNGGNVYLLEALLEVPRMISIMVAEVVMF